MALSRSCSNASRSAAVARVTSFFAASRSLRAVSRSRASPSARRSLFECVAGAFSASSATAGPRLALACAVAASFALASKASIALARRSEVAGNRPGPLAFACECVAGALCRDLGYPPVLEGVGLALSQPALHLPAQLRYFLRAAVRSRARPMALSRSCSNASRSAAVARVTSFFAASRSLRAVSRSRVTTSVRSRSTPGLAVLCSVLGNRRSSTALACAVAASFAPCLQRLASLARRRGSRVNLPFAASRSLRAASPVRFERPSAPRRFSRASVLSAVVGSCAPACKLR